MTTGLRLPPQLPSGRPPTAAGQAGRLTHLLSLYRSSVGRKFVMALSGIAILGFVGAHLFGTLKIFLSADATNHYGEAIRALGGDFVPRGQVLWILRAGLTAAFGVHLHAAFSLDRRNRTARSSTSYQNQRFTASTYASRTMLWSGVIVALFVVFHIADLTWGVTNDQFVHGDPYTNQIASFSKPPITAIYLLAIAALVAHLHHGIASLVRSLGIRLAWWSDTLSHRIAVGLSAVIGIGYSSVPLAVLAGFIS